MRALCYFDKDVVQSKGSAETSENEYLDELQRLGHAHRLLPTLAELERVSLVCGDDILCLFLGELTHQQLRLLQRLLTLVAIPVIVNARQACPDMLAELLSCGRVTYVPDSLQLYRLDSIIRLASIRFDVASESLEKMASLELRLYEQQQIAKAKARLQASGLSESQAHQALQRQAMKQGVSIATIATQLIQ